MKYWRGYLTAGIIALCTWGLSQFAAGHTKLVDMIYPYVSRIIMDYLAQWSSGVEGCLWQILLVFLIAALLGSVVLMVVLRWNPVQWLGWVLAAASVISLLSTGIYGLNKYSGPLAEDLRLEVSDYSVSSLERAAEYYASMAKAANKKVKRDEAGQVQFAAFEELAQQAGQGFQTLTYDYGYAVFSGATVPVKQLGWTGLYKGQTGVTVGLTGESAVNPEVPAVLLPFAMGKEMSRRMCIYGDADAKMGGFLTSSVNKDAQFRYSGYLVALRCCYNALEAVNTDLGRDALSRVKAKIGEQVLADMALCDGYLGEKTDEQFCKLLVSWYMQTVAIFEESDQPEEDVFDPMDETDERLQDIINPTEAPEVE